MMSVTSFESDPLVEKDDQVFISISTCASVAQMIILLMSPGRQGVPTINHN